MSLQVYREPIIFAQGRLLWAFPFIFFLIKKRSKKIKLKIGNCCAPFTIGFTCVVLAHRTSNPSFIIADFQRTIPILIYKHGTTIEIYSLRSKKRHSYFNKNFSNSSNLPFVIFKLSPRERLRSSFLVYAMAVMRTL